MINYFLPNKEFLYIHKPSDDVLLAVGYLYADLGREKEC